jgi:hypothetical protein
VQIAGGTQGATASDLGRRDAGTDMYTCRLRVVHVFGKRCACVDLICVCVCVCLTTSFFVRERENLCTLLPGDACMHVCIRVHVSMCVYITCTYMYTCTSICKYINIHTHIHTYIPGSSPMGFSAGNSNTSGPRRRDTSAAPRQELSAHAEESEEHENDGQMMDWVGGYNV